MACTLQFTCTSRNLTSQIDIISLSKCSFSLMLQWYQANTTVCGSINLFNTLSYLLWQAMRMSLRTCVFLPSATIVSSGQTHNLHMFREISKQYEMLIDKHFCTFSNLLRILCWNSLTHTCVCGMFRAAVFSFCFLAEDNKKDLMQEQDIQELPAAPHRSSNLKLRLGKYSNAL